MRLPPVKVQLHLFDVRLPSAIMRLHLVDVRPPPVNMRLHLVDERLPSVNVRLHLVDVRLPPVNARLQPVNALVLPLNSLIIRGRLLRALFSISVATFAYKETFASLDATGALPTVAFGLQSACRSRKHQLDDRFGTDFRVVETDSLQPFAQKFGNLW